MSNLKFARRLASLPIPSPKRQNSALQALAKAQGRPLPAKFDLGSIIGSVLKLAGDNPALLSSLPALLKLLPSLVAIWAAATGGAAGDPGKLPGDTQGQEDEDEQDEDIEEPPAPPTTGRTFAGLTGKYGNFQSGAKGQVKADPARGRIVFEEGGNIDGANAKTKFIAYLTPTMSNGQALKPGDPENDQIKVDYYAIWYDGKLFKGDDIQNSPIEVNNHASSNGMNPRLVIEGIDGAHTVAFEASVNGHVWRGKTLFINRH